MSIYAQDPGDLTPDEMYGAAPVTQADGVGVCRGCHTDTGELDTEIMDAEGACTFGCGRKIREDGMCSHCRDHSANEWECPMCATTYADWSGQWAEIRRRLHLTPEPTFTSHADEIAWHLSREKAS